MGKLYKSKNDLPEWYPLEIYKQDLTAEEWLTELALRYSLKQMLDNGSRPDEVKSIFSSVLVENERNGGGLVEAPTAPGHIWGIKELSAYEFLYLAQMANSSNKAESYLKQVEEARTKRAISDLVFPNTPLNSLNYESFGDFVDWEKEPFGMRDAMPRFPVSVDLDQDDETLELAFKIWLAGARAELGSAKKPFSEKDFEEWKKFGVLPVFDLTLWASLGDGKYTNKLLADTLWPLDEEDTTERLRKVTMKKIEFLFNDWTHLGRLWKQVSLSKSLMALLEENRNEK